MATPNDTLSHHLREGCRSLGAPCWAVLLVVSLNGWIYPLLSLAHRPGEPLSVAMLYKADPNYLPSIRFLAHFCVGEGAVLEAAGQGINTYPFVSIALHALFLRLFGPIGLSLADTLAFLAFFALLVTWLHLVGIRAPWGGWAALLLAAGATEAGNALLQRIGLLPPGRPLFSLYEWRVARPLVTEPFFLLWLFYASILLLVPKAAGRKRVWAMLGLGYAGMAQGSFECALVAAYGFPFLLAAIPVRAAPNAERRRRIPAQGVFLFLLTASVAMLPFWLQRLYEDPDQPRRIGAVIPYTWSSAGYYPPGRLAIYLAVLGGILLVRRYAGRREDETTAPSMRDENGDPTARTRSGRIALFLAALGVLSYFGPAITAALFGRVPIPADFYLRFIVFFTYALLLAGLDFAQALFPRNAWRPAGCLLLVFAGFLTFGRADRLAREEGTIGYGWAFHPEIYSLPRYRQDFAELVKTLDAPSFRGARVLGTFDRQLYFWWIAFRGGHSFLADPYAGTLPDVALEDRLLRFARLLGMETADFRVLIREPNFLVAWLGACKYWVTRGFGIAPPEGYAPSLRPRLAAIHPYRYFHALPEAEEERLVETYARRREWDGASPRLDLVVLPKIASLASFAPPAEAFPLVYENRSFRVWRAVDDFQGVMALPKVTTCGATVSVAK